jgi:hypothetical protein
VPAEGPNVKSTTGLMVEHEKGASQNITCPGFWYRANVTRELFIWATIAQAYARDVFMSPKRPPPLPLPDLRSEE